VKGFNVEHGDVLLSIQMILTREEEVRRRQLAQAAPRPAQQAPHAAPRSPQSARPTGARSAPAPANAHAPVPPRNGKQAQPVSAPVMVDPLTGVGTIHALRRDLMLQQTWPVAGRQVPVLVGLEIAALDQVRADLGPEAANHVLKCLVEVAPFALRAEDRIYRSGRNQLTLLLPGVDRAGAESARTALETALQRRVADRGYPELHLAARRLDPVALAS
jgi:GGDEF domain-containing protein